MCIEEALGVHPEAVVNKGIDVEEEVNKRIFPVHVVYWWLSVTRVVAYLESASSGMDFNP